MRRARYHAFKRDDTSAHNAETSVTKSVQPKSQAAPTAAPGKTEATATIKVKPEVARATDSTKHATIKTQALPSQREPSAEPPPDAGSARTTNLLIGAMPTVPAGGFQKH
jgi:hypothetical protein